MKNIKLKITSAIMLVLANIKCTAIAADIGDPTQIGDAVEKVKPLIVETIKPISAVLIFLAVIILGINMILKRNKPDERMGAMTGLLTVAIGSFIIGVAGLIYSFIMTIVQ